MNSSLQKVELRNAAEKLRARCNPALASKLAHNLFLANLPPSNAIIAGYLPIRTEIDIRPLLNELLARGHTITLPETPRRGRPLIFRRWTPETPLIEGRFKTQHPDADILIPDFILTPLLAFDQHGHRLGYGAGYYDISFASLPEAERIGCAFSAQRVLDLPAESHDIKLHAILTETGLHRFP